MTPAVIAWKSVAAMRSDRMPDTSPAPTTVTAGCHHAPVPLWRLQSARLAATFAEEWSKVPMDAILEMLIEAVIYLVAYLVDWLRWWRLIVCVLIAGIASLICYQISNVLPLVFALLILACGITAGFIWEHRTPKDGHV